ncbi:MAG TPA: DNA-binding response regulator [Firmicutes bacterium]|nr:DNA-binding response regulator [Bacillota bacterium]
MKILVIEDDVNISFALERFFAAQGNEVTPCLNLELAFRIHPEGQDFIILDLNLPDGDGFEYLSSIRSLGMKTPLLLLTVRDQEKDMVRGLTLGADDYLTKPFSLPVLKARMEAILRRASLGDNEQALRCGRLVLHKSTNMALVGDRPLELSSKEYDLLELFMENQGLTLPRERILDRIWGWERGDVYDNTLSVSIKRLREKLEPYQDYIRTVRGIGYRMAEGDE